MTVTKKQIKVCYMLTYTHSEAVSYLQSYVYPGGKSLTNEKDSIKSGIVSNKGNPTNKLTDSNSCHKLCRTCALSHYTD